MHTLIAKETNKALPAVTKLIDKLESKSFSKKEILLTAGGGITQDISSFVRAVYKRGIDWTFIPTTLLAMADSCIGAKACLNYGSVKNQLGLFSAPRHIYINTQFLKTLPERDILSGFGEIIKLCIVGGTATLEKFKELSESNAEDKLHNIDQLIKLALITKKAVIEIDEFEKDIRRALNYGHTIGHAIEPLVKYKIPHGIAVSIGMVLENLVAAEFGSLSKSEATVLNDMITPFIDKKSLRLLKNISIEGLVKNMKKDKKAISSGIYCSVPVAIGHFDMLKLSSDENLKDFLEVSIDNLAA
jgi:3-dehydroquinate synthase